MEKKIIALGYFDSIHIGHTALLNRAKELAKNAGAVSTALVLYGECGDVFPLDERIRRIKNLGIDEIISLVLDDELKNTSAADFIHELAKTNNAVGFVCGEDFTYGKGALGNAATLKEFCAEKSLTLSVVSAVNTDVIFGENSTSGRESRSKSKLTLERELQRENGLMLESARGKKVSTTLIKTLLKSGEIEKANKLLSEPYCLSGEVAHGNAIGRKIGFPTANVKIDGAFQHLIDGVYVGECITKDGAYKSIINYGFKPTVDGNAYGAEAHLKDFSSDIYGERVRLVFLKYLRKIQKFDSLEDLKNQLKKDKESLND